MKANELLKKILLEMSKKKVHLGQATLDNGTVIEAENFEVGAEVFIVTEDERIPLPVGEYTLEDGEVLVVNEEGLIGEIATASTEEAEGEVAVEAEEETIEVEAPAEVAPAVEEIVSAVVDVIAPMVEEMKKQMEEIKEEMGKYKEKMSKTSAKVIKHSPAKPSTNTPAVKLGNAKERTTADRVFERLYGNK